MLGRKASTATPTSPASGPAQAASTSISPFSTTFSSCSTNAGGTGLPLLKGSSSRARGSASSSEAAECTSIRKPGIKVRGSELRTPQQRHVLVAAFDLESLLTYRPSLGPQVPAPSCQNAPSPPPQVPPTHAPRRPAGRPRGRASPPGAARTPLPPKELPSPPDTAPAPKPRPPRPPRRPPPVGAQRAAPRAATAALYKSRPPSRTRPLRKARLRP